MNLLPPKELNTRINDQKKTEINAGLFLSKKVDALRETLAEEQQKFDAEMKDMENRRQLFLSEFERDRIFTLREVEELERKKLEAQKPLDEEWHRVKLESTHNSETFLLLLKKEKENSDNESLIFSKQKDLNEREQRLIYAEIATKKSYENSEEKKKDAERIHREATDYEKKTRNAIEETLQNTIERERVVAYREVDAKNKERNLKKKETELNLREKKLAFRERNS